MNETVTIQKTHKRWKVFQLFGALGLCIWVVLATVLAQRSLEHTLVALPLLVVGGVLWLIGRIGAWWQNG